MIDPLAGDLIPFIEVAARLPRAASGNPVSLDVLHRWRRRGRGGRKLEAVCIRREWFTTGAIVAAFLSESGRPAAPASPTAAGERAGRELEALGL